MVKRSDWVRRHGRVQTSDSKRGSRRLTGDKGAGFSRKYLGFSICNGKENQNMRRLFLPVLTKTSPTPESNLRPPVCHKQMREVDQKLGAVAGACSFNSCLFREASDVFNSLRVRPLVSISQPLLGAPTLLCQHR